MYRCNNCNILIKFNEKTGFITKCHNCGWYNRLIEAEMEEINYEGEDNKDPDDNRHHFRRIKIMRYREKQLITYDFDIRRVNEFKKSSKRAGQVLEKFLKFDKINLSSEEKNVLYKLRASSLDKINERMKYLRAKKECIKLLHYLDF